MTKYYENDLWWHLKLGEFVAINKSMPWLDKFSYTFADHKQYTGEWLGDLIIYETFHFGGFLWLNIFKASIVLISFFFIALTIKEYLKDRAEYLPTIIITFLVALFAIRFRLYVRPYLFTMLFLVVYIYLLEKWKFSGHKKTLYVLPLLMLIWTNMSVGAVFGTVIVGMAGLSDVLTRRSYRLLTIFPAVVATSLLNPEGYKLYSLAFSLTNDPYRTHVPEYRPLVLEQLWGSGYVNTLPFLFLIAGSLIYLTWLRGWKNPFHIALFAFFLYEAFRQVRLIEVFGLIAAPFLAYSLARAFRKAGNVFSERKAMVSFSLTLGIVTIVATGIYKTGHAFGYGVEPGTFPEEAIQFLERNAVRGRMFNSYGYGGYLTWRVPDRPVFIDGRYRRIYSPEFAGEYLNAITSLQSWHEAELKYGFDYAIVSFKPQEQGNVFPVHLVDNPDWAIVYWDSTTVVAVRRTPERAELIKNYEYRITKPGSLDFSYLDHYLNEGTAYPALSQLDREISRNPDNQFPALAKMYLLHQLGTANYPEILRLLEQIMPMKPNFAMKHSAYAHILFETGQNLKAQSELKKAIALNPLDSGAVALAPKLKGQN